MANKKVTQWQKTYETSKDRPYDLSLFRDLVHEFYGENNVQHFTKSNFSNQLNEGYDRLIVVSAKSLKVDKIEQQEILNFIKNGGFVIFVVGEYYHSSLDEFGYKTNSNFMFPSDSFIKVEVSQKLPYKDSFVFETLPLFSAAVIDKDYKREQKNGYSISEILSEVGDDPALSISYFKNGGLIMNHMPATFTNHFLINKKNEQYVWNLLNHLPKRIKNVLWLDYKTRYKTTWQPETPKPKNPLSTLTQFPMWRIAIILTIMGLALYLIFGSKRVRHIIPRIKKKKNTYLDFVDTISFLYFNKANHQNLIQKMIQYFYDTLRTDYQSPPSNIDEAYIQKIAIKSRLPYEEVVEDFKTIQDYSKNKIAEITSIDLLLLQDIIKKYRKK
jgi:hypothetical protein